MLMHHDCSFSERANKQTIAGNAVIKKPQMQTIVSSFCMFLHIFAQCKKCIFLEELVLVLVLF